MIGCIRSVHAIYQSADGVENVITRIESRGIYVKYWCLTKTPKGCGVWLRRLRDLRFRSSPRWPCWYTLCRWRQQCQRLSRSSRRWGCSAPRRQQSRGCCRNRLLSPWRRLLRNTPTRKQCKNWINIWIHFIFKILIIKEIFNNLF